MKIIQGFLHDQNTAFYFKLLKIRIHIKKVSNPLFNKEIKESVF